MDGAFEKTRSPSKVVIVLGLITAGLFVFGLLLGGLPGVGAQGDNKSASSTTAGWQDVIVEDFESGISAGWVLTDLNGTDDGEYYWFTTTYTSSLGQTSAWATGGGADGSLLDPATDSYPGGAVSRMAYGPVDLTGTTGIQLDFDYWLDTQPNFDLLAVMVSTNGVDFSPVETYSGNSGGWQSEAIDLGAYAGVSEFWLAFYFSSDGDAIVGRGAFVDNIRLQSLVEQSVYLPLIRKDPPPPTPTPTPTPPPFYYYDDFSDSGSGWSTVYNPNPQDWYHWYYENGRYKLDIGDDRTDVKSSPGADLPNEEYVVEVDGRFRSDQGWWTSYGIIFDGKDDPNPNNSDLGDYFMLWILWEGSSKHKWGILNDYQGGQDPVSWQTLDDSYYNYGSNGLDWNHWKIVRKVDKVEVYCNGGYVGTVNFARPTTNYQVLFGLYGSTYETSQVNISWDNYKVTTVSGRSYAWEPSSGPIVVSGEFVMDDLLPEKED